MNLPQRHKQLLLEEKEGIEKWGTTSFQGRFIYVNESFRANKRRF